MEWAEKKKLLDNLSIKNKQTYKSMEVAAKKKLLEKKAKKKGEKYKLMEGKKNCCCS